MTVTLNRETHEYTPNRPSVTTILGPLIDKTYFTDLARERGSLVHLACEYYDLGDLDFESLDPAISGYVQGFVEYRRHYPVREEWIEIPRLDGLGQYAGTPDRVIIRPPKELIDLKTGEPAVWHRMQTAAYVNMFPEPMSFRRYSLYLKADGRFKLIEHPLSDYPMDIAAFRAAMLIYEWKKARK